MEFVLYLRNTYTIITIGLVYIYEYLFFDHSNNFSPKLREIC